MTASSDPGRYNLLRGYVIVDVTTYMAGPLATHILCALGATVIKVEPPHGELMRGLTPVATPEGMKTGGDGKDDLGLTFLKNNASKMSVALDMKAPEGAEALRRLVASADALVHNYRPAVATRLGLDAATVRGVNPEIVYCAIDGLGPYADPKTDRTVIDQAIQAMSGIMAMTGGKDGPPTRVGMPMVDTLTGLWGAIAVLAGLLERGTRKDGKRTSDFSVSLLGAASSAIWASHIDLAKRWGLPDRIGNANHNRVVTDAYKTADGEWVMINAFTADQWAQFVRGSGIAALADPRFADPTARRLERAFVENEVAAWVAARTREEILGKFEDAGIAIRINSIADVLADKRYAEHFLYEVQHPVYGATGALDSAFPIRATGNSGDAAKLPAPLLGQHTEFVLCEYAGMSDSEIRNLKDRGVAICR